MKNPWTAVAEYALNPAPDGNGYRVGYRATDGSYGGSSSVSDAGFADMVLHAETLVRYGAALEKLRRAYPVCNEHGIDLIQEDRLEWSVDPYLPSQWNAERGWPVFMLCGFHAPLDQLEFCVALCAQGLPDGRLVLADSFIANVEPRRP